MGSVCDICGAGPFPKLWSLDQEKMLCAGCMKTAGYGLYSLTAAARGFVRDDLASRLAAEIDPSCLRVGEVKGGGIFAQIQYPHGLEKFEISVAGTALIEKRAIRHLMRTPHLVERAKTEFDFKGILRLWVNLWAPRKAMQGAKPKKQHKRPNDFVRRKIREATKKKWGKFTRRGRQVS